MFNVFKKKPGGQIEYYGLTDWWLATFSPQERKDIGEIFQPIGFSKNGLTEGEISYTSGSATQLLYSLAGWFNDKSQRTISYRLLKKAEELAQDASVFDRHFLYQTKIEIYYRFRDIDTFALSRAIKACEQQIAMNTQAAKAFKKEYPDEQLPSHVGFKQLTIIRDKEDKTDEAIKICEEALKQGWSGDWQKRIQRYQKKIQSI